MADFTLICLGDYVEHEHVHYSTVEPLPFRAALPFCEDRQDDVTYIEEPDEDLVYHNHCSLSVR